MLVLRDDEYFVIYCRKARSIVEIFRLMHYDLWGHKQFYLKSQCASAVKALWIHPIVCLVVLWDFNQTLMFSLIYYRLISVCITSHLFAIVILCLLFFIV